MEAARFSRVGGGRRFLGLQRKRCFCSRIVNSTGRSGSRINHFHINAIDQANYGSFLIFYCVVSDRELNAHRLIANTRGIYQFVDTLNIRVLVDDVSVAFEQTSRLCNLL